MLPSPSHPRQRVPGRPAGGRLAKGQRR